MNFSYFQEKIRIFHTFYCWMSDNEKLFELYDHLKKVGKLSTYVEFAVVLNTNKAGVNDLKTGKKKLSIDHLKSMKKAYPKINLDWFIAGAENMIIDNEYYPMVAEPAIPYNREDKNLTIETLQKLIKAQEKTILALETVIANKSRKASNSDDPVGSLA